MKKKKDFYRLAALAAMSVVMMAGFSSCSKDNPDLLGSLFSSKSNPNNNVTDELIEYVGVYNARYTYTWSGQEYYSDYILTITKSETEENTIIMSNVSDYNYVNARASVNGTSFTIPQQTFISLGISGSGTLNGNTLTFSTSETHTDYVGALNISHKATKM